MLYGSGLRHGFTNILQEQQYYPVNVGYEHVFHPNGSGQGRHPAALGCRESF